MIGVELEQESRNIRIPGFGLANRTQGLAEPASDLGRRGRGVEDPPKAGVALWRPRFPQRLRDPDQRLRRSGRDYLAEELVGLVVEGIRSGRRELAYDLKSGSFTGR